MKEVVEFREIGGMTFSEKVIIVKPVRISRGQADGIVYILGLIVFFIVLYWNNITEWFKKKSK
jgi:hypothetical protein